MNPHTTNPDPLTMYDYSAYNYNHLPPQPMYPYHDSLLKAQQQYINPYLPVENVVQEVPKVPEVSSNSYVNPTPSSGPINEPTPTVEEKKETPIDIVTEAKIELKKLELKITTGEKKRKARRKIKKERSNYWSEKITEEGYPFYECAMCSLHYSELHELDSHVTIHEGRLTSYDLKLRNKLKKKLQLRQKKKAKKEKEEQKLKTELDIEIKPEDGYIGDENATDYFNKNTENNATNTDTTSNHIDNNYTHLENVSSNTEKVGISADNVNNDTGKVSSNTENVRKDTERVSSSTGNVSSSAENVCNKQDVNNETKEDVDTKTDVLDKKKKNKLEEMASNDNLMKIYKCHACQKQFALSYYLKLHVRSHTDEKPYPCNQCPQSFITASKRNRHIQRIHHAVKYQCRICFKLYSKFDQLTKHFDKKHPEDKLEGEPYDFNEILPYLKDLEAELLGAALNSEIKPEDGDKIKSDIDHKPETESKPETDSKPDIKKSDTPKPDVMIEVEPKIENYWPEESWVDEDGINDDATDDNDFMNDDEPKYAQEFVQATCEPEIAFEPVKCDVSNEVKNEQNCEVEVKIEIENSNEERVKECDSDEEYFPSNTWLPEPKQEFPAEKKKRKRGPKKKYPTKCEICEKTINSASYMAVHLRTHTGERPFKCYICDRGFITSNKMHRHVLTHPEAQVKEESNIKCEGEENDEEKSTKKKKSKSANQLLSAKKKYKTRNHVCEFCQKRFKHIDTLNVHRKSHDGQQIVLKCQFCMEVMVDDEAKTRHEATHTGPKPYLCTICGRSYLKKLSMMTHRKQHSAEDSRRFVCDVCSKTFNAECKLQKHMVSHSVEKFVLRYECPVCAHMFNTKYHIQMHLQTHQKEGLIIEENKNEILAMVLQNARKIPSKKDCSPALTEIIPNDERSRVCNICGEVFQHFYYLEEHLKSHGSKIALHNEEKDEEKKHICPVCNKGFKLHYYLKLHSFTHTKEKPFACHQCGKGFITKGKLKRHLETHSGLKKYQCHVCYKFFTRPSYLRIHIRTIHGTQDYNFRLNKQYMDNVSVDNLSMMS